MLIIPFKISMLWLSIGIPATNSFAFSAFFFIKKISAQKKSIVSYSLHQDS